MRVITGFVEPHFFAGFSGGPKAVCPGLAATETILEAHHPRRIADARATFLTRQGNPVHDFVRAAVALAPPQLSLDVAINRARRVTAVFAGPLAATHDAACAHVGAAARRDVPEPVRPRGLDQRGPPARPQPVPVGEGDGGGRPRTARRRRRCSWRRRAPTASPTPGRSRACWPPPARRPTSSPPRPGRSSIAGRRRCWAASWRGARWACTATAWTTRAIRDAQLVPVAGPRRGRRGDARRAGRRRRASPCCPEGPLTVATLRR